MKKYNPAHYLKNRSKIRSRQAEYYQKTKKHKISKGRAWYWGNRELVLEQKRRDYEENLEKHRDRNRRKHIRRRNELDLLKSKSDCADCHCRFPPCCMDFDHLPGTNKTAPVGNLYLARRDILNEEISKCEVVCKVCHRIRTHNRREPRKRRNPALEKRIVYIELMKSNPCSKCGNRYHPAAMDFHHNNESAKVMGIALLTRCASIERLKEELTKCVLLCANCHSELHYNQKVKN